ncbi:MAG: UDP-3-O-(3-hydroxymyristoyl)glucosamine N-acyltransferase [Planctomycetes bacterium]|nr:UDP-3-O-(3-hydroxymyristoyl)glucosamine N-acyltransferase [Planctomycetota bacterium]
MKLKDLAQVCEANLEGDGEIDIVDVGRVDASQRNQVCFIAHKKYLPLLEKSKPGAIIAAPGVALPQGANVLRVADADLAFSKAVKALRGEPLRPTPGIADNVVVGPNFDMGDNSSVGPFTVIGVDVKLGKNVIIYPHCYIGDGVTIGDDTIVFPRVTIMERCIIGKRCTIQPGAVIGADGFGYHFVAGKFVHAPQRGHVHIHDDVDIGANTTIDRARFDVTEIKAGSKIDNLVQVAHNVNIGQNCVIAGQAGLSGSVVLKDYVRLGGNVGVGDHITIGMGAQVAAKTGVMQDVAPGMKMAGLPADEGRKFMKREAAVRRLPDLMVEFRELKAKVERLAAGRNFEPVDDEEEDMPEAEPGTVTRFIRNRPAPMDDDK